MKVFRFTYEKTKSVTASVYVPAKTKEEAEKFLKTQEDGDLGYDLDTDVMRDRSERDAEWSEWELLGGELSSETVDGQYIDWDYDEDVLPALNPEDED